MIYNRLNIIIRIDDIFSSAKLYSAATSNRTIDNSGLSQELKWAITDEDKIICNNMIRNGADSVYSYLKQCGIKANNYSFGEVSVAVDEHIFLAKNSGLSINVSLNDRKKAGHVYKYSFENYNGGAVYGTATIDIDGNLTYMPQEDYCGYDNIIYLVENEGFVYKGIVNITIGEENTYSSALLNVFGDIKSARQEDGRLIKYILYLHEDWDVNLRNELQTLMFNAILHKVLSEWFKHTLHENGYKINEIEADTSLKRLKAIVNWRKYVIRKPHITF